MLNRPTEHCIESMSGMEAFCPEFSSNRLFLGGDVGQDAVLMLHGHEDLQVRRPICRQSNACCGFTPWSDVH